MAHLGCLEKSDVGAGIHLSSTRRQTAAGSLAWTLAPVKAEVQGPSLGSSGGMGCLLPTHCRSVPGPCVRQRSLPTEDGASQLHPLEEAGSGFSRPLRQQRSPRAGEETPQNHPCPSPLLGQSEASRATQAHPGPRFLPKASRLHCSALSRDWGEKGEGRAGRELTPTHGSPTGGLWAASFPDKKQKCCHLN